jgi:hypothetical protein
MTKYLLTLLYTFCSLSVFAQVDNFHKGTTIFIVGGVSIPGSEFANATGIEVKDYVDRGPYTALGFKRDVHKYFAVGVTGGYSQNKLNIRAIEEASSTSIETVPWKSSFLVADFYAQMPIQKWTPYLKGSAGAAFPNNWEFYAEQSHSNGTFLSGTTNTTDDIQLAYMAGIGITFTANKFVLGLESNGLAYKPEFEIDLNGSPGRRKEWIATFNQSISIGYKF